jgi:arylsulfatase A-like enzyme
MARCSRWLTRPANIMQPGLVESLVAALVGIASSGTFAAPVPRPDTPVTQASGALPNVVFILLDDLGKEWISCYGAEGIQTPNIDQLAATGMKFNNAYSMPQCSPSRACLMTGQYPFRNGWVNHWDVPRWGVGYFDWRTNPSIGRVMRSAGYKTAAAGKWQLNDFRLQPDAMVQQGFDEYCMWTGGESDPKDPNHASISNKRYWNPYIHTRAGSKTCPGKFGPDIYNQFLLDFITRNKDHPFFIYYPMALVHLPLTTTPLEPGATGKYGQMKAMVRYADYLVGKMMDHLDQLGIRDKTLIIFTTDNGTAPTFQNVMNGRMVVGGKTKTTENGVCEPFIVNWSGKVPAGTLSDALIDFTDVLPTLADLAGVKPEPGFVYDGFSAKDVFLGKAKETPRDWILAMGSLPGLATTNGIENVYWFRDRVIRETRYKLFVGTDRKPQKLVDVIKDPGENTNLMNNPEYRPELERLSKVIGQLPEKDNNPIYTRIPDYPRYGPLSKVGQSRAPEKRKPGADGKVE